MALPTIDAVATAFLAQLRKDIGETKFAELVAKQKANPIEGVCYSHDYCDANMTMDAALRSLGVDPLPDLEEGMPDDVNALWNASWDRAVKMMESL